MPKGKKKGKKKSEKKVVKQEDLENNSDDVTKNLGNEDIFEDKEEVLKEKFFQTIKEIEETKYETELLKEKNNTIEIECEKVRNETEAFSNYLDDREENRKNNLVTLQDYHQSMIKYHIERKTEMLGKYDIRKEELQVITSKKDQKIRDLENEVLKYKEDLEKRDEQLNQIQLLESQIRNIRSQQATDLEKIKLHFIKEHEKFEQESTEKINEISRVANKEAMNSLSKTFNSVLTENRALRQEMLWTMKQNKLLNERKITLLEENRSLKEELQYEKDFALYREVRQEKPKELKKHLNK